MHVRRRDLIALFCRWLSHSRQLMFTVAPLMVIVPPACSVMSLSALMLTDAACTFTVPDAVISTSPLSQVI